MFGRKKKQKEQSMDTADCSNSTKSCGAKDTKNCSTKSCSTKNCGSSRGKSCTRNTTRNCN